MELSLLQNLMYVVFLTSMYAYAALDGFDIGVGCVHLFTRQDINRRIFINSIGPVWDSNSLWVVITGGVLLSGFPPAFATVLSALYIPTILFLFCFIYRAVAIEFRSKKESPFWRSFWDVVFSLASFGLAFGLGVVIANLIQGLPIDAKGEFVRELSSLFSPYAVMLGFFTVVLFMLHGTLYLKLKTEGDLQKRMRRWAKRLFWCFTSFWVFINAYTLANQNHVMETMQKHPLLIPYGAIGLLGIIWLYHCLKKGYDGYAFISSCVIILSLVLLFGLGTYPNLIRSQLSPAYCLTIFNSSSSPFALKVVLGMACAGVPLFFFYLIYTYRVFKGKVEIDTMSY
jgi:cytochrome d ubiquinol oxidase subunit II